MTHGTDGEREVSISFDAEIDRSTPGIYDVTVDPRAEFLEATFVVPGLPPEVEEFSDRLLDGSFDVWGVDAFELDPERTTVTVGRGDHDHDAAQTLVDELQVRVRELYEDELPSELFDSWNVYHVSATPAGVLIDAQLDVYELEYELEELAITHDEETLIDESGDLAPESMLREAEALIDRAHRRLNG